MKKYDEIVHSCDEKKKLIAENKSPLGLLFAKLLESENAIKTLKESYRNRMAQYLILCWNTIWHRPCWNWRSSYNQWTREYKRCCLRSCWKSGIDLAPSDISVSHRLQNRAPTELARNTRSVLSLSNLQEIYSRIWDCYVYDKTDQNILAV